MGSIFLTDFKFGMDRRRKRVAGVPGTLWSGKNVQISRGGDIERSKRFVPAYTLPTGRTFGLAAVGGQLFTFGSAPAVVTPLGVQYQQLVAPSGAPMTGVLDVRGADGKLYVIAKYGDGNVFHFYDGARVTDWDTLADTNFSYSALAAYLAALITADSNVSAVSSGSVITITALQAGTAFTATKSTNNFGSTNDQDIVLATPQANVLAVAEVRATSSLTLVSGSVGNVTDIIAGGVSLMAAPVTWQGSATATMAAIVVQINNKTSTHGYSAEAVGSSITLTAPLGDGAAANGTTFNVTATIGNIVISAPSMSGGVTAVTAVAQITTATFTGTPESQDAFTLTINGTEYKSTGRAAGTGTSLYVQKKRVFSPASSLWEYCRINTFNDWHTADVSSGAGFLNVSNDTEGSEPLVGAGTFVNLGAVFSRRNCRIYNMDADAQNIAIAQPVDNTGALSSRSILSYGTTDLFYLDETGIRSLKARDSSGAAFVNDIGVAIDTFVREQLNSIPYSLVQRACAVVEPIDGRYWIAIGNRIYVLSYFPGSQISAWTYFEPGFQIDDFARCYNQLYIRSGDSVYLYGGTTGLVYPNAGETPAVVELPFASTQPPTFVGVVGYDMAATNTWQVDLLLNPDNEAAVTRVGQIDGITYTEDDAAVPGRTTHIAVKMTCAEAGDATISNLLIRHDGAEPNA